MQKREPWGQQKTIKRQDVANLVFETLKRENVTKRRAREIARNLLESIRQHLTQGNRIELRGLLVATPVIRAPRKGREIYRHRAGIEMVLPAKKTYRWALSPDLEAEIAGRTACAE